MTGVGGSSPTTFVNPAEMAAANIMRCIQAGRLAAGVRVDLA
jgi:hypothetical protein